MAQRSTKRMPSRKPHHQYDLVYVVYDNGEGLLIHTVGWAIVDTYAALEIAATFELKNDHEWVTVGNVEIPPESVISKEVVRGKW